MNNTVPTMNVDALAVAEGLIDAANACPREQAALRVRLNIAAHTIKRLSRELAEAKRQYIEHVTTDVPAFLRKQAD